MILPKNNMSVAVKQPANYLDYIKENNERKLYLDAKAKREAEMLPKVKLKEDDVTTYKNIIPTKAKQGSPIDMAVNFITGGNETANKVVKNVGKVAVATTPLFAGISLLGKASETEVGKTVMDKAITPTAKFIGGVMDKSADVLIKKPLTGLYGTSNAIFQGGKGAVEELASIAAQSVVEDKNPLSVMGERKKETGLNTFQRSILKTADDFETKKAKTEILFGTQSSLGDYLNFHSAEEKRRQAILNASPDKQQELQKFYDDTAISQTVIDVTSGIAAGLLTGNALGVLAKSTAATKPILSKILASSSQFIDKGLIGGSQVTGGLMAVQAATHYLETGEYIFDDDKEATEAMFSGLLATGLKAAGKGVKELAKDKDVMKGFTSTMNNIMDSVGNKIEDVGYKNKLIPSIMDNTNVGKSTKEISSPEKIIEQQVKKAELDEYFEKIDTPKKQDNIIAKKYNDIKLGLQKEGLIGEEDGIGGVLKAKLYQTNSLLFNKSNEKYLKTVAGQVKQGDLSKLNEVKVNGKLKYSMESLQNAVDGIADEVELTKLQNYLTIKDRLTKTVNKEYDGVELGTSFKGKNWSKTEMEDYVKKIESENINITNVAKKIYSVNESTKQVLLDSGVISKETYEKLKTNPYYIPSKLSEEDVLKEGTDLYTNRGLGTLIKRLDEGIKEGDMRTFSEEALFDIGNYTSKAMNVAKKNKYINDLVNISAEAGNDIILKEGQEVGIGNVKVPFMQNGERVTAILPEYVAKKLRNNYMKDNAFMAGLKKTGNFVKAGITGKYNPLFAFSQLPSENIQGALNIIADSKNTKGLVKDLYNYYSTPIRHTLSKIGVGDKEGEKLLSDYISATSADMGFYKSINNEFTPENLTLRVDTNKIAKKFRGLGEGITHILGVADKWGSRGPMFMTNLLQQLDGKANINDVYKVLKDNTVEGITDFAGVTKGIKKLGANDTVASNYSRSLFDYTAASDGARYLGAIIPYINIVPTTLDSMAKFSKKNPKKVAAILAGMTTAAMNNYAYNYGEGPYDNEEGKARGKVLRSQDEYRRFKSGLATVGGDGKMYFNDFGLRNNQIYTMIYGNVVLAMEAAKGQNKEENYLKNMLSYNAGQLTSFDLKGGLNGALDRITPNGIKQIFETVVNKDIKYDKEIYNKGLGTSDVKGASTIAVALSELIANSTGGEKDDMGVIQGGVQVNPKVVDVFYRDLTPKMVQNVIDKYLTSENQKKLEKLSITMDEMGVEGENVSKFTQLLSKAYSIINTEKDSMYKIKEEDSIEYKRKTEVLKNKISNMDKEELKKDGVKLLLTAEKNKDEKLTKFLETQIRERINTLKGKGEINTLKSFTAENIAGKMAEFKTKEEAKQYFKDNILPYVSEEKGINILKEYKKTLPSN